MPLTNLIPGVAQAKAVLKFLPYIGIAALGLFALIQLTNARHWHKRYLGAEKALSALVAKYEGAQATAQIMNKAQIANIEANRREIAYEKDAEIRKAIDLAVADAKRVWGKRATESLAHRAKTGEVAIPADYLVGGSGMSLLDENDVRVCTVNTVKAKAWQDFYDKVKSENQEIETGADFDSENRTELTQ